MIRIAHLADIHIQNRRREEYQAVFAELYAALRREAPTVIVVAGDVFDDKMRASAHNLEDVAAFLAALADVAPVVLIPGNHDTDVQRPGALDLLTPLLADHRRLQPPRLTYWRHSGVYEAHGVEWHVKAPDGPRPEGGGGGLPRVCLFHEELNGALLPNGQRLRDFALARGDLAGYDAALGGHIHLRQLLGERIGYCGSLVQQNIGERHTGHGFVVWDLRPSADHAPYRTAPPRTRGVDVPNRLGGFLRVELAAGGEDLTVQPAPLAPLYWEVVHDARAPAAAVEAAAAAYTARFGQAPRAVRPCSGRGRDAKLGPGLPAPGPPGPLAPACAPEAADLAEAHEAFSSPDAHAALIRRILGASARTEAVVALHADQWRAAPALRGARVRLIRLEFDNLYCFGPGNVVDFTRLEGAVSGTVAPNHAGKSALLETLLLALFEEHPRAATKAEVIRVGAASCRLALDFEVDGRRGRIEKAFGRSKGRATCRLTYAGEDRSQGDAPATLREARGLLGSAEAALATSVQLQGAETSFVTARPLERRRLLAAALELGRFDALERATGRQLTALKGEARGLAGQFRGTGLADLSQALEAGARRSGAAAAAALAADSAALEADGRLSEAAAAAASARARAEAATAAAGPRALGAAGAPESAAECLALRDVWLGLAAAKPGDLPRFPGRAWPRPPPPEGRAPCSRERLAAAEAAKAQAAAAALAAGAALAAAESDHARLAARNEGLERAAAAAAEVAAARRGLDAQLGELTGPLGGLTALFPELPPPPAVPPEPELPFPGFAERSGPRPSPAELAEALPLAQGAAETCAALAATARRADPDALAALRAGQAAGQAAEPETGPEPGAVAAAEARAAGLAAALQGFAAETVAAAHGLEALPGAESGAEPGAELDRARQRLEALRGEAAAQAWLSAGGPAPQEGCPRCQSLDQRLGPEARAATRRALQEAERSLPAAELRAARAALGALRGAEAELAAVRERAARAGDRLRLRELEAAEAAGAELKRREAAAATVERECHWRARAREAWAAARAARGRWIAALRGAALARKRSLSAARASLGPESAPGSDLAAAVAATVAAAERLERAREAAADAAACAEAEAAAASALASDRRAALEAAAFWAEAAERSSALTAAREAVRAAEAAARALSAAQAATAERREAQKARLAEAAAAQAEVARLQALTEQETGRAAAAAAVEERLGTLQAYRRVLKPADGIAALLLERARGLVARRINDALRELGAPLEAELTPEFALRQRAARGAGRGPWLAASLASGYQRFVLGLAARLALWRLTAAPRLDALFVDEGFSACDAEYLEGLGSALEALAAAPGGPRLVFVVSHLDALKARIERVLEIRPGARGSRVANAGAPAAGGAEGAAAGGAEGAAAGGAEGAAGGAGKAAAAGGAEKKGAGAGSVGAAALAPDPRDPARLWCAACRQSLNAGNRARHLGSQKHARAAGA